MKKKVTENVSQDIQNITKIYYKLACLYLNLVIILLKKIWINILLKKLILKKNNNNNHLESYINMSV